MDRPLEGDQQAPDEAVVANWEAVTESVTDIAATVRNDGWDVLTLTPGNIAALGDNSEVDYELDVLVSSDEYATLEEWVAAGADFSTFEIYKNSESGVMYCVIVLRDSTADRATVFPLYYDHTERSQLVASAETIGAVRLHLHPLSGDGVTVSLNPDEFFASV